jgi:hypothetical protein
VNPMIGRHRLLRGVSCIVPFPQSSQTRQRREKVL